MKGLVGKSIDYVWINDLVGKRAGTVDIQSLLMDGGFNESPSLTAMARRVADRMGAKFKPSAIIGQKVEGMRPVIIYDMDSGESSSLTVKSPQYITGRDAMFASSMRKAIEEIAVWRAMDV